VTSGRAFDDRDQPDSAQVVIVGESLAQRLWPGRSPVGRTLVVDYSTAGTYPYEVVGVASDIRFRGPRSEPRPEVYFPHAQRSYLIMHVVIRASGDPRALIPEVRDAMKAVDAQKPAQGFRTLDELLGSTYARDRQVMATLSLFAATATFLAMLGVYGALSQRVRERSREIGIRIALGANARRVATWVGSSAVRLLTMGLAIGLGAGWILAGTLRTLLFGVAATDAVTAVGVMVLLAFVGGVAALVPAVRAMRIDPVTMLRRP
jgi:putative ABC transport system permease protein